VIMAGRVGCESLASLSCRLKYGCMRRSSAGVIALMLSWRVDVEVSDDTMVGVRLEMVGVGGALCRRVGGVGVCVSAAVV
jgi:hypothetical protein